jgi:hypothetical protein
MVRFCSGANQIRDLGGGAEERFDCMNFYMQLQIVSSDFWQNEAKLCSSFNGC